MMSSRAADSWVSKALARARARRISGVRYLLDLRIDARANTLRGCSRIEFDFRPSRASADVLLDWRPQCSPAAINAALRTLRANAQAVSAAARSSNHITVPAHRLAPGNNVVEIAWTAPIGTRGAAIARYVDPADGANYLHSLFVPADASSVFPCFDQPDLKGRFELTLTVPKDWSVISNAPLDCVVEEARSTRHQFRATEPLSTYAFAFAAGPWVALSARTGTDPTRLWVRRSQRRRALVHADEVLRLNQEAASYCARYFGHPFPFAKYDLVLIPDFPYRGMEHAGATFLNESSVVLPLHCSTRDEFRRAQLVFHETAHQWLGNLVTMRWFDDLWLKEGFANFIAYKLAARVRSVTEARVEFLALRASALRTDQTRGATALRCPLTDLAAAKTAYGSIVYAKAPAVLREVEAIMGTSAFRRAVRRWVRRHAYGATDGHDLIRALGGPAGERLRRWVLRPGVEKRCVGSVADLLSVPEHDYVVVRFAPDTLENISIDLRHLRQPAHRMRVWEALWQGVMDARLAPRRYIDTVLLRLGTETDSAIVECVLRNCATGLNTLVDTGPDDELAHRVERFLWAGVASHPESGAMHAWLNAYLDLATTARGLAHMRRMLTALRSQPLGATTVTTRARIAAALVARGMEIPAAAILKLHDAAPEPGRLSLLLSAARPDLRSKRAVFARYIEDSTLPESWIAASLTLFNHPAHHTLTCPLLPLALQVVPRLYATRKIFFVEQWIASFIDGQHDAQALTMVRTFLRRGSLDVHLRRKLLEHADRLARTVRIRARFVTRAEVVTEL